MTRTIDQMITSEVLCCMSSLVATLANTYGSASAILNPDGSDLAEQAFELAAPIDDWEEAAVQAGWTFKDGFVGRDDGTEDAAVVDSWQEACELDNIEPYAREVYEHWAVTDWFADKLEAAGEKVDRDFANLIIWARTTCGQALKADDVIQRIYAETHTGLEG